MNNTTEEPVRYAVRFYERAIRDINQATVDYLEATGDETRALELRKGLRDTATSLRENPGRYAVGEAESMAFGFPVRRVLYRLSRGSSVAYHLIYFAVEEGEDEPTVSIVHVRHAHRAPLTQKEAAEIKVQK